MNQQNNHPKLILGTAMWGWTIDRKRCFELLDTFYLAGYRDIDAATNYPINKKEEDFRRSENILLDWIKTNGVNDLKVMMKIGSINNMFSPENNLSKSFMLILFDEYKFSFEKNLETLMVHWDNRNDATQIHSTLEALEVANKQGFCVGLSGIKHPDAYAELNKSFKMDFRIQIKHNLLQSDYERYKSFHGKQRFITYGINGGGIKLHQSDYKDNSTLVARGKDTSNSYPILAPLNELINNWNIEIDQQKIQSFNQIGMCWAFHSPDIEGILIGPSSVNQMEATFSIYEELKEGKYHTFYKKLQDLKKKN
ncbi:MAG: hypothetical protein GY705_01095 [Bacteroidetes bacterium]|nr:hypothetical protein [Bacteroidota bacterium]